MDYKFKLMAHNLNDLIAVCGSCFATNKNTVDGESMGYLYR